MINVWFAKGFRGLDPFPLSPPPGKSNAIEIASRKGVVGYLVTLRRSRKGLQWQDAGRRNLYETIWPAVHCSIYTPMDGTHVILAL